MFNAYMELALEKELRKSDRQRMLALKATELATLRALLEKEKEEAITKIKEQFNPTNPVGEVI